MFFCILFLSGIASLTLCGCHPSSPQRVDIPVYTCRVVHILPHDSGAFTQGFAFTNDFFYEGTGLHGHSSVRKVAYDTGTIIALHTLDEKYFGEGITLCNDKVIQITEKARTGFIYRMDTCAPLSTFSYSTDGWGITWNGTHLIMSDGSAQLYFLDPENYREARRITVRANDQPVETLNELEWVDGEIYANIWPTKRIAIITPSNGNVRAWIELESLIESLPPHYRPDINIIDDSLHDEICPNGIAYDAVKKRLFITGKLWPCICEVECIRTQ